jgi:hypothetical protein
MGRVWHGPAYDGPPSAAGLKRYRPCGESGEWSAGPYGLRQNWGKSAAAQRAEHLAVLRRDLHDQDVAGRAGPAQIFDRVVLPPERRKLPACLSGVLGELTFVAARMRKPRLGCDDCSAARSQQRSKAEGPAVPRGDGEPAVGDEAASSRRPRSRPAASSPEARALAGLSA